MKISVIIPVFNEKSETVNSLVTEINKSPEVHEIILVDDFSEEEFHYQYKEIKRVSQLIRHTENKGKSAAVKTGFEKSTGDHILIIDGDIHGITKNHIEALAILGKTHDIVCLTKGGDNLLFKIIGSSYITRGDHLIKREVIEKYKNELFDHTRWGFDININYLLLNKPISFVFGEMVGCTHTLKIKKYNWLNGIFLDLKMVFEIVVQKYKIVDWFRIYYKILPFIRNREMIMP